MSNKQLSFDLVDADQLVANTWNTNVVSPDNEMKLAESIKRFGMFKPVVVRTLEDGTLEVLGGEHRWQAAGKMGIKVPIINLGHVDDQKAKEISLVDNGRYGSDDTLQLAELLSGLGNAEELTSFMPYSETDLASIFSSVNIALDSLDIDESDEVPSIPREKPLQTSQVMRFKIPVGDVATITERIEKVMKQQGFNKGDSLENAGDALVHIFQIKD